MNLLTYLNENLVSGDDLLRQSGVDADTLAALQKRRMAPRPSYTLRLDLRCESFFGARSESAPLYYYAVGTAAWIGAVLTMRDERDARAHFETRYLGQLHALDTGYVPDLASEWEHFLDGTYGLCTRTGLPEAIAQKEAAIAVIKPIVEAGVVDEAQRERLRAAVELLDSASSPFAPHERERSSRHRYIEQVRAQFL